MAGDGRLEKPGWLVAATPALLLLTPFVIFTRHHGYPLVSAEILGCLLVIGAVGGILGSLARRFPTVAPVVIAGSIVGLVDLQFDLSVPIDGGESAALLVAIVALTAILRWAGARALMLVGVMAAAAFATTLTTTTDSLTTVERRSPRADGQGPFILHLILDEHIGPAGLQAVGKVDDAARVRRFLEGEGFLVFDAAYGEHFYTFDSLGHILNFVSGQLVEGLVVQGHSPYRWTLTRSQYLTALANARYAIDVYQTDHLDLCHGSTIAVASCHTYASKRLGVVKDTALTPVQRGTIVLGVFLARSDIWIEVSELYHGLRARVWPTLPGWDWARRTKVAPIAAVSALERLEQDLRGARRGQAIIAHVLLPHAPYVYDGECRMRPPSDWQDKHEWVESSRNTPEGRAVRYTKYVGQLACTQRWIGRLLQAIPAQLRRDAIVIVHGDHGSRITISPAPPAPPPESDDVDIFSTLFAIRSPTIPSGLDVRQSSIACLLKELVAGEFRAAPSADACASDPVVLETPGHRGQPRPLQRFERGM